MRRTNKFGNISLCFGIAAILLINLFGIIAVFLGYKGMKDAENNLLVSKWQANAGIILGVCSIIAFVIKLIPTYNP